MSESELIKAEKAYRKCKKLKGYKSYYQLGLKRLIDIIACIMAMPFVMMIFIPVAIAIKIEDGGPVFYRSKRLGIGFREFDMLKFRSMKVNAPDLRNNDGSTYNSDKDPRVTKIGHFMRVTSIDELPQVFNALKGEMSIIGPRAGDVESKDTYQKDEKDKFLIRPGITGYTQAYYRNGLGVREKRLYDAWYAHKVSFFLDVKIFFKTIKTVLMRENVYTNK